MLRASVDLSEFNRSVDQTKRELSITLVHAVNRAARAGRDEAKRGGFRNHSGKLRAQISAAPAVSMARGAFSYILSAAPYSRFVEYGTRAHIIRPKEGHGFVGPLKAGQSRRKRTDIGTSRVALRWYVGGKAVFARVVHHPGSAPYPFMAHAAARAEVVLREELRRGFVNIEAIWS